MTAPMPEQDTLLDHALRYAAQGLEIFPANPANKHPYTENGMQDATTDPDQIRAWWARWPAALIACRIPDTQVVLDVDPRHSGLSTWEALQQAHQPLPHTRRHASGRGDGGQHWWFQHPGGKLTVKRLNQWARDNGHGEPAGKRSWTAGIDLLHHGHRYSILPPSPHPDTQQPYRWVEKATPARMPAWLVDLLTPDPTPEPAIRVVRDSDGIADWYTANHSWHDILPSEGWTLVAGDGDTDGSAWRHPNASAEHSATIRHGCLFVYSPNTDFEVTEDGDPNGYTRFRAWATLEHGGDLTAAAAAAYELRDGPRDNPRDWLPPIAPPQHDPPTVPQGLAAFYVNWADLFSRERATEDWLAEPFLANGRGHVLYAPAKAGKSLLVLEVAAAIATGRPVLNQPAQPPRHVIYVDYEMTEDDLIERIETFGYTPDDIDQLRATFHYALLPSIPGLDTAEGGRLLAEAARAVDAALVVVDTTGRAVEGPENEADTIRAFYRHTGLALKAAHVAWVRLDHAGKDLAKGQRGSSAKNDDVDVVWKYSRRDNGATLEATHRRMSWVPEKVDIALTETVQGLRHQTGGATWPAGTKDKADELDKAEVPLDCGRDKAKEILRAAGITPGANPVLSAAIKYRKERARKNMECLSSNLGDRSETDPPEQPPVDNETDPQTTRSHAEDRPQDRSGQVSAADAGLSPYLVGDRTSGTLDPQDLI